MIAFISASIYSVSQIISPPLIPVLKSPVSDVMIIGPSIILALAYSVAISCLHRVISDDKKVYSQIAVAFSLMYAIMVSFVYIIQLATVIPSVAKGQGEAVLYLSISSSHWIQAVDGFGYALMSVSMLFGYAIFPKQNSKNWLRRFFIFHGVLAPFIILPLWIPEAIVVGTLWFISGPVALLLLTKYFKQNLV